MPAVSQAMAADTPLDARVAIVGNPTIATQRMMQPPGFWAFAQWARCLLPRVTRRTDEYR